MAPRLDRLDGLKHINISTKGKTVLGRLLSNSTDTPFECEDGKFSSVEGYQHWITSKDEEFRELVGYHIHDYALTVRNQDHLNVDVFREKIKSAIRIKIKTHEYISHLLIDSDLPFDMYSIYKNKSVKHKNSEWIIEEIELIRKELQDVREKEKNREGKEKSRSESITP